VYWLNADPSLLLPGNPVRSEFLARVVNAEISWTDDEKPLKGAQSPKGEIHIRYGPADYIANHRWYYYTPIDTFFEFRQTWGYGTAAHTIASLVLADSLRKHHGSMFFNVPLVRRGVDTIRAQVARFRSAPDSIVLFVVAELPVGSLRRHLATDASQMQNGLFTFDGDGALLSDQRGTVTVQGRDSLRTVLQLQRTGTRATATLARVELLEPDTERIARGIFDISGFGTTGFGISDIILSTRITAPRNADRARWQEFVVQPALGATFVQGTPIDLLWETYGRQSIDGTSRHRVEVSVRRVEQQGLIAVGARVIGSVRGAVTGTPGADRLAVVFERSTAHQPELAEYLRLGLQDTRPGRYRLSVRVTDLHSGAAAERVREFVVLARR
jgi:GWxTD domain-containing protein